MRSPRWRARAQRPDTASERLTGPDELTGPSESTAAGGLTAPEGLAAADGLPTPERAAHGRHALPDSGTAVRVADLLASRAAEALAAERGGTVEVADPRVPVTEQPAGTELSPPEQPPPEQPPPAEQPRDDREREWLVSELASARMEIDQLGTLLDAAVAELVAVREAGEAKDAELAEQRAAQEDNQTWWELRLLELQKDVQELSDELAEREEDAEPEPAVSAVAGELERLRIELEQARAEALDASAEADAAFVELSEAYATLTAAESRIAALERRQRTRPRG